MAVITVNTTVTAAGDGHTSLQEAFAQAVRVSIATGQEVTIRFAQAMDISVMKTLVVPSGARIVLDGDIAGSTTTMIGANAVTLHGDSGTGYDPNSTKAYGHTLMSVAAGGSLRLSDVGLADNLVAGADGHSGASGTNGPNGTSGSSTGLQGSSGDGGLSVTHNGTAGGAAVSGILNLGTLVLDRVNMNDLKAYAGDGGAGGNGGSGGNGGNGNAAVAGSGGPGGSGLGHGAVGGEAAAGVMNRGTLTMLDTSFQSDFIFAGVGGAGGSGGTGGNGGTGTIGGFGGNGGSAGNGGTGGNGAVTVLNHGTVNTVGGWVYDAGANLIWGGSGAGGAAGSGGAGGTGGKGAQSSDNGFNGVGGSNGVAGTAGTEGAAVGWSGTHVATSYYIEANRTTMAEYAGATNPVTILTIYRLGDATGAGSVDLAATGLGGALGGNLQGGLYSGHEVDFAAGQNTASVYVFAQSDGIQGGVDDYRFTISAAVGGVLGGNVTADVAVTNRDIVGGPGADNLSGTAGADVILGGLGNDTLRGFGGDDRLDGQGGINTVDYFAVQKGLNNLGLVANLSTFTATGKGAGTDALYNIENVLGSRYNDSITGDFNANILMGRGGSDHLYGSYGKDTLVGGLGRDTLTGGVGADQFVFAEAVGFANLDHISDFAHGSDKIVLTHGAVFHGLVLGGLTAAEFHLGLTATTATQHILYDRPTGTLYYDPDGSGAAAAAAFAVLGSKPLLDYHDFLVI